MKVHTTEKYHRFRIKNPALFDSSSFRIINTDKKKLRLIIGKLKKKS